MILGQVYVWKETINGGSEQSCHQVLKMKSPGFRKTGIIRSGFAVRLGP